MSFTFKKFKIQQELAAMKVGLDAVVLGAWAAGNKADKILDIGCGTGLLSLMMAQRFPQSKIQAIDIDNGAIAQSEINFKNSDFVEQLDLDKIPVQQLAKCCHEQFDAIVCNPPYFTNALKAPEKSRRAARHDDSLSIDDLLKSVSILLNNNGVFSVVFPLEKEEELIEVARSFGLFNSKRMLVRHKPEKPAKRGYWQFEKIERLVVTENLTIKIDDEFTKEFKLLTQDFYLAF